MRNDAQCVIIGGGAMGVGLLYHLAHEGWTDTLLIEKGELTSGSTWHAAGLVPHFIGSLNMAKVHAYGAELYTTLEAETGMSTGWHGCGAIRLAVNQEQAEWYRYVGAMLDSIGIESHLVGHDEIRAMAPLMESIDDVVVGFHTPNDGWSDPANSAPRSPATHSSRTSPNCQTAAGRSRPKLETGTPANSSRSPATTSSTRPAITPPSWAPCPASTSPLSR